MLFDAGLAQVCNAAGIPLIVDEAHGAHFGQHATFPASAMQQGAHLAVQSTHKTLSAMTQAAMLHVKGDLVDRTRVARTLQILQVCQSYDFVKQDPNPNVLRHAPRTVKIV